MLMCSGGPPVNLLSELGCVAGGGIIGRGRRGDPMRACSRPTACAARTNWVSLLGLKVMKLPLS